MSLIICLDPKTLLWSIFSSEMDGFCARDLTDSQLIEWHKIAAAEFAKDLMKVLKSGGNPYGEEHYLSYSDCLAIHNEFSCEEPPVVNPILKKTS